MTSAPPTPRPATEPAAHVAPVAPVDLHLDDTAAAFAYKSDGELRRARLLFQSLQVPGLVRLGPPLLEWALRVRLPVRGLVESYFFNQFCGGVTLEQSSKRSAQLWKYGVGSTLDYAVEGVQTEKGFDACRDELLRVIGYAQGRAEVSFVALKMTGLAPTEAMAKVQAGQGNGFERTQLARAEARLEALCAAADAAGVSLLLDAEESWIQDVIDGMAERAMARYNRQRPVLYTTTQHYRHDRLAYLEGLLQRAQAGGWVAGVKLVRGAYLEKENARAAAQGYATPMQPSKAATDRDFDAAALLMIAHLEHCALVAGTHNEHSCELIAGAMQQHGLAADHPRVHFSQLFGMSDNLSFGLAGLGYRVAKYLPYGPLEAVMPYLTRRAQENSAIAGQSSRELELVSRELERRRRAQSAAARPKL